MIYPQPLKKGDTIALLSPSSGLASIFPHRLDRAVAYFKNEGFNVVEYASTRSRSNWESASAKDRAKDLMDAFLNPNIRAIVCTIGGETSNKLLEYLDYEKIKQNPKIFCGYSDISVLHYAMYSKTSLVTFYGPCAMTQFGEYPKPLEYTTNHFYKAVSEGKIDKVYPSSHWTNEILDWGKKEDLVRARKLKKNRGYEWLKHGNAKGTILGGCLLSITHLLGTEYWPDHKNVILFFELPPGCSIGEGTSLSEADAFICDLKLAGILEEIKGLIVGRPYGYTESESKSLKEIISEHTNRYSFPILYGADIGHTDPQITIPIGSIAEINSKVNSFKIMWGYPDG